MAHKIGNRIKETASTSGTVSFTLAGAVSGFVTFASKLASDGDTTWYCAVNGTEWEVGTGTRTSSTVLARTTVLASSNSGSLVNFSNTPTVFGDMPAEKLDPGPAVSAYRGTSDQSFTSGALTKVQLNTESFDVGACFDSTTNYRWTPNVAGYYNVAFSIDVGAASGITFSFCQLLKNGTAIVTSAYAPNSSTTAVISAGTKLVYMNGTTDYLELHGYSNGSGTFFRAGEGGTFLTAYLARHE